MDWTKFESCRVGIFSGQQSARCLLVQNKYKPLKSKDTIIGTYYLLNTAQSSLRNNKYKIISVLGFC